MRVLNIFKAQGVGRRTVDDLTIQVVRELPQPSIGLADNRPIFEKEAEAMAEALHQSLPGGTFDRLLIALLKRKASDLIVPYGELR